MASASQISGVVLGWQWCKCWYRQVPSNILIAMYLPTTCSIHTECLHDLWVRIPCVASQACMHPRMTYRIYVAACAGHPLGEESRGTQRPGHHPAGTAQVH